MSKLVLTRNDIIDVPATGKAHVYVKADGTLALLDASDNEFVMATTKRDMLSVPRRLMTGRTRLTAAQAAGTYWFTEAATLTSAGMLTPLAGIYIDAADFPTIDGQACKLTIRAQLYTNDVAPGTNLVIGLYPVTRPATSGGAGLLIYTPGTVITGSTVTFTAPTADAAANLATADFAVPAPGHYAFGFTSSAAVATNAHVHMQFQLQVHN